MPQALAEVASLTSCTTNGNINLELQLQKTFRLDPLLPAPTRHLQTSFLSPHNHDDSTREPGSEGSSCLSKPTQLDVAEPGLEPRSARRRERLYSERLHVALGMGALSCL